MIKLKLLKPKKNDRLKKPIHLPIELFLKKTILYGLKEFGDTIYMEKSHLLKVYLLISIERKQSQE
jgi:hypothetical protein